MRSRTDLAVYVLTALFLIGTGTVWWSTVRPRPVQIQAEGSFHGENSDISADEREGAQIPDVSPAESGTVEPAEIVVHVAGAVKVPGVYTMKEGQRVYEAVEMAGGPRPDAALDWVNLARTVNDGERIYIPAKGEISGSPAVTASSGSPLTGVSSSRPHSFPVDVNTADAGLLDTVPGIGPSIAAAIISYRTENGPFRSVEDLLKVPGIGPKTLSKIAPYVTVR